MQMSCVMKNDYGFKNNLSNKLSESYLELSLTLKLHQKK